MRTGDGGKTTGRMADGCRSGGHRASRASRARELGDGGKTAGRTTDGWRFGGLRASRAASRAGAGWARRACRDGDGRVRTGQRSGKRRWSSAATAFSFPPRSLSLRESYSTAVNTKRRRSGSFTVPDCRRFGSGAKSWSISRLAVLLLGDLPPSGHAGSRFPAQPLYRIPWRAVGVRPTPFMPWRRLIG